jgi:hypothetical protein
MFPKGCGRKGGAYSRNKVPQNRTEGKQGRDRGTQQDSEWHETGKFKLHNSHSLAAISLSFLVLCCGHLIGCHASYLQGKQFESRLGN